VIGITDAVPMVNVFQNLNYRLVHYSDGTRFFKNQPGMHALYLIFARTDWILAQQNSRDTRVAGQAELSSLIRP
jgi:hypothetical protein